MLEDDLGPHEPIQQQVGAQLPGVIVHADDGALHPVFRRDGGGETAMVGLGSAQGEQHGGPLILGVLQQIFQLAQLVHARPKVREIVPVDLK